MAQLLEAGPGRVAFYGIENHRRVPVYVHAKVCVIDDWWATIGSDNFNRRSWTHDSELSAVVLDAAGGDHSAYARRLRLSLAAEHLDREFGPESYPGDISVLESGRTPQDLNDSVLLEVLADCVDPHDMFDVFASSARSTPGVARRGVPGRASSRPTAGDSPDASVAGDAGVGRAALPRGVRPRRAAPSAASTARVLTTYWITTPSEPCSRRVSAATARCTASTMPRWAVSSTSAVG